jgi:Nif-specific regulatory protein
VRRTATLARGERIVKEDLACAAGECLSATLWTGSGRGAFVDAIGELAKGKTIAAPVYNRPAEPTEAAAPAKACEHAEAGDCPAVNVRLTEKERLLDAMERAGWVQAKAARILDITPRQIGYALRKYRIEMKRF